VSVIDELSTVTTRLIQTLLLRLLRKDSAETRAAAVATAVLRRCESKLCMPLAQAIIQYWALAEAAAAKKEAGSSSSPAGLKAGKAKPKVVAKGKGKCKASKSLEEDDEDDDEEDGGVAAALLAESGGVGEVDEEALAEAGPFAQREMLHQIIVGLAQAVPSVLLLLMPALARELEVPSAAGRASAASVLGALFALAQPVSASEGALTGELRKWAR